MSVLSTYFSKRVPKSDPILVDFIPAVLVDEEGKQYLDFVEVDYPSIIKSNGKVTDWSLDALVKAGVNPDFKISTSFGTRLQGYDHLQNLLGAADQILSESKTE